ncbi:MAG TPA: hypothetical protein VK070_12270 [Acidimicrobiia bacterium]|nr:hypothetical protein [Acidimicrobiia bacterium]
MYAAASTPVVIGDDRAHLTITVTAPSVVGYLEEQPQDDLEATVCRLLELGVDTARRIDQRADAVGLDDVRNALTSDLAAIRAEIGASIDHLTKVATTVTDRVSVTSAEAEKTIRSQVAALPEQLRQVISDATADPALAAAVSDALKGDDSPIRKLEQRLAAGLGRAAQANDAALAAAVEQIMAASGSLNRLRGALEERRQSPAGGTDYESQVENELTAVTAARGDVLSDVRHVPGNRASKKGDFLVHLVGGPARVAVEVKRTSQGLSAEAARALVDSVTAARDADAALLVFASPSGMPAGLRRGETFGLVGQKGVAVCFPPDEDPVVLAAAYSLARTVAVLATRAGGDDVAFDRDAMQEALDQARERIAGLKTIARNLNRVRNDINAQIRHLKDQSQHLSSDLAAALDELAKPQS